MTYDLSSVHVYSGTGAELSSWEPMDPPWIPDRRILAVDVTGTMRVEHASDLRVVRVDPQGVEHEMRCNTKPPAGPDVRHDGSVGRGAIIWAMVCGAAWVVFLAGLWCIARGMS